VNDHRAGAALLLTGEIRRDILGEPGGAKLLGAVLGIGWAIPENDDDGVTVVNFDEVEILKTRQAGKQWHTLGFHRSAKFINRFTQVKVIYNGEHAMLLMIIQAHLKSTTMPIYRLVGAANS
jgi:hypothetical protein